MAIIKNQIFYLIGMMGVGKSYIGLGASKRISAQFYDLDHLIRQQERKSIADIFKNSGETGFRKLENKILKSIPLSPDKVTIISCGGGTPLHFDNLQYMKETGTILWLYMPIEIIVERLRQATDDRPMLEATQHADFEKNVRQLYEKREPTYQKADHIMDATGTDEAVIAHLMALIKSCQTEN